MTKRSTARVGAAGLVILQLVLLAALVLEPYGDLWPRNATIWVGAGIIALAGFVIATWGLIGLGSALTASPIPKEHAPLVTHGLYGLVRNPIYSGLLIVGAGFVVLGASWWHLATWIALVALLAIKSRWEERMLSELHPEFGEYARRVGRFIPGIGRWRRTPATENGK